MAFTARISRLKRWWSLLGLALDNIGWSRTERKSCFPMSLTSWSSSCDSNKYGGIWWRPINLFKGCSPCYCYRFLDRYFSLFAAWTIFHHIYFLSWEGDHDVRVIGKHDFCSALPRPMLSNANRLLEGRRDTLWRLLKSASIKLSASLNISRDVLFPFEITPKRRVSPSWILSYARWSFSIHGQLLFFFLSQRNAR